MIAILIGILLGVSALLLLFGVGYDFFVRKSFMEVKKGRDSQNIDRAKSDAANQNVSSQANGYLP